ncbi:MAG: PAS domain S-box protein [Candidatus Eisenbacteria bacterium]|uniref:histidine kinase n=1 Tax=Eiseniibacteriota bacterium TaxID=2212470 RepID=A0A933W8Q4_UNCEI|nr:PAS domain S-box protein [Candidatus Eisenbacteria bacterium]
MPYRRAAGLLLEQIVVAALLALCRMAAWAWLDPGMLPPISPVAGLAIGLLLLRGLRVWPAVLVGGTLGAWPHFGVGLYALGGGLTLTVQSLLATLLLRRWPRFRNTITSTSDIVGIVVCTIGGSLPSAFTVAPALQMSSPGLRMSVAYVFVYFVLSQVIGVLAVTPAMLAFVSRDRSDRAGFTPRRVETLLLALAVLVGGAFTLLAGEHSGTQMRVLLMVISPLFMWAALRGSPSVALALPGLVMLLASYGDAHSVGLFARSHFPYDARGIQAIGGALTLFTALLVANECSHRQALREVSAREARLQRVLSGSNDGFWEWNVRTGELDISERVAAMLGLPLTECPRFLADYLTYVHPDDAAHVVRAMQSQWSGAAAHHTQEYRLRHRAGHWVWVQSRGRVAERDDAGHPVRISGTASDVTEQKQAELALRASQELFTSFMRYSPAPAFIFDGDSRLVYVNRAYEEAIWGDDVPDWRGKSVTELFPSDAAEEYRTSDRFVFEEGRSTVVEQNVPAHGGTRVWLTVKFPLHDHAGAVHVGAMSLDITDRRNAEEQRRVLEVRSTEAQKLESLGLLAGGIAHDFNNILTSILGHADLARTTVPAGSPMRESLDQIVVGARSAAELTRQMLAYAGRGSMTRRPLVLSETIAEMGQLLQVSIGKRTTLHYDFAPGVPAIEADEAQLRQVVMNLILNASEAIGETSGAITLGLRARTLTREALASRWTTDDLAPGDYVEFEVRDTGAGMSDETLARIFDPFFSTKFTGRGLGLAAVLGIVRTHRGTVHVESALGRGTAFRVLLPACHQTAPAPVVPNAAQEWRARGVALLVDDEESVRRLANAMLVRIGFDEVIVAAGGSEGIERFRERADDIRVVLLDLTMPDMDGEAVLAAIREHRPDAKVILSSGYSAPPPRGRGAVRADGFLGKPYRLEELTRTVRDALERVTS